MIGKLILIYKGGLKHKVMIQILAWGDNSIPFNSICDSMSYLPFWILLYFSNKIYLVDYCGVMEKQASIERYNIYDFIYEIFAWELEFTSNIISYTHKDPLKYCQGEQMCPFCYQKWSTYLEISRNFGGIVFARHE